MSILWNIGIMLLTKQDDKQVQDNLKRILELSDRISRHSPPMKPFIRFSRLTKNIFKQSEVKTKPLFWDFDYTLQKILLFIAKSMASPQQITRSCIERYKNNLEDLCDRKQRELNEFIESHRTFQFHYTPRDEFIFNRIQPESKLLYVGCGSGTECLRFAKRGRNVVGIDTNLELTDVANRWAECLNLSFSAVCMDVMALAFRFESFDSFLIEFYGDQPLMSQTLALQRNLAQILRDGGIGFVVAIRKRYASHWYLMGSRYPAAMHRWLKMQYLGDHLYTQPDGNEELLMYGLYYKSHTPDSLASELSGYFDIIECNYEKHDPRYVVSVVRRKENLNPAAAISEKLGSGKPEIKNYAVRMTSDELLEKIDSICDCLESHENNVLQYFQNDELKSDKNPLKEVKTELLDFTEKLEEMFKECQNIFSNGRVQY